MSTSGGSHKSARLIGEGPIHAITEEIGLGARRPSGFGRRFIGLVAFSWSCFQLWVIHVPFNDTLVRSIHLSFALVLLYLAFPITKKAPKTHIPIYDWVIAILAGFSALYLVLDFEGISARPGLPLPRDIVLAVLTVVLLLEGTRRSLGPALTVIGFLFLAYCYFGPHLPDLIAHRGASIRSLTSHMYLSTEGIFGVPLRVSANVVFIFVLLGALLEKAGAGRYFIQLAYSLLGRFRGGPAKAAIVASGLTGMINGSSIANTVTTGTFTIPLMKKVGLPAHKAAAVEVAASTNGQLMPPIMGAAAFIIAEFLGIAYLDVIKAAFIPAVVSYIGLFFVVDLEAAKLGLKGLSRQELPKRWQTFVGGLHHFLPIFVLIHSLVILKQSPGKAAFGACLITMLLILAQEIKKALFQRTSLTPAFFKGFTLMYQGFVSGARNMIPIGVATAAAGLIVGTITLTGLGQRLLDIIEVASMGSLVLVLFFTAITSLILGMGLPTTANYIVMASLTAPIIVALGQQNGLFVPAIAAHLFVFYFGILADDTPPVGLAAYAASAIARSDPIKTGIQGFTYDLRTAILPWIFLFNTNLLLIHGIEAGGDPMNPSSWIWVTHWWDVAIAFGSAVLAMLAFVVGTMGWGWARITWMERMFFFVACLGLFRPGLLAQVFEIGNKDWMLIPPLGLLLALGWVQKMRKKRESKTTTPPLIASQDPDSV